VARVLVTRPEPGATATARRLAAAGHEPVVRETHAIAGEGDSSEAEAIGRDAGARIRAKAGPDFFSDWT